MLAAVAEAFTKARLLVTSRVGDTEMIEVSHEALIREWPRLGLWIDEQRDDLRTERRLNAVAAEWVASDRDSSLLITGGRLDRYEQWAETTAVRPTTS